MRDFWPVCIRGVDSEAGGHGLGQGHIGLLRGWSHDLNPGGSWLWSVSNLAGDFSKQETVTVGGSGGPHSTPKILCPLASWTWLSQALSGREVSQGLKSAGPAFPLTWKGQQALPGPPKPSWQISSSKKLFTYQG